MNLILITGKSGSGKSTFAKLLAKKLNYLYIDIDAIIHNLYSFKEVIDKAQELFGNEIFENGIFNKKNLGKIFFNEKSKRVDEYKEFTYNYVVKEVDKLLTQDAIIDYILLPQTKYWNLICTKILVQSSNDTQRFELIKKRDNITDEYIQKKRKCKH